MIIPTSPVHPKTYKQKALNEFKFDQSIIIKEADKGIAVKVMDADNYVHNIQPMCKISI